MTSTRNQGRNLGQYEVTRDSPASAWIPPGTYRASGNLHETHGWVYLYLGRRRVWDCNPIFFSAHFVKVAPHHPKSKRKERR